MISPRHNQRLWDRLASVARKEVEGVLDALPPELRRRARDIPYVLDRYPPRAWVREGLAPDTLGVFTGSSFPEETFGDGRLPPQVLLFLGNLWEDAAEDAAEFRLQVRQTFLHELGHYLGLEEEDLEARSLE